MTNLTLEQIATTATVVLPVVGAAVTYMHLAMGYAVRGLKLDLIKELNGTYIRRESCAITHQEIKGWLSHMQQDITKLDKHVSARLVPLESLTHSKWEPMPAAAAVLVTGLTEQGPKTEG